MQTGVEEIYEIYDVESDIGVDIDREMPAVRQFGELRATYDCGSGSDRRRAGTYSVSQVYEVH